MNVWTRFEQNGIMKSGDVISSGKTLFVTSDEALIDIEMIKLLPPCQPSKIIGIGANYPNPVKPENPELRFFFKPPSGLITHKDYIVLPKGADTVIVEPELAIIIGQKAKNVSVGVAKNYIAGYTLANDVAVLEQATENLALAKCYDTFTPVGPWVVKDFKCANRRITLTVNGEEKVSGNLSDMFFSPEEIVARLSNVMTLEAGDLILTGTPHYFGPVKAGDVIRISIPGIGSLDSIVK